jgi:hypothetical protein
VAALRRGETRPRLLADLVADVLEQRLEGAGQGLGVDLGRPAELPRSGDGLHDAVQGAAQEERVAVQPPEEGRPVEEVAQARRAPGLEAGQHQRQVGLG